MRRNTSRAKSFQGPNLQRDDQGKVLSRGLLILLGIIFISVPVAFVLRARQASGMLVNSPLRGIVALTPVQIELNLDEADPVVCSGPPTRAVISLRQPLARAQAEYKAAGLGTGLQESDVGLVDLVKDCYETFVKDGGDNLSSRRETGDKALSKRVEACFMESTVGDEAARKALYESIYVAKVLRLYGTFRPQDLMILRSEDLSTDNASFTRHWLNKAEAHLSACSYKLTAKPMSAVDQALSAPSQPLYEAFEPWNKKLSELLGREMRWSTLLSESVPSAVAVSALDDGDSLLKQSTATAEKADAEAAAVAPPAEEEKKPEATTTPEDRMLKLIAGSPVMIFSKSYCPYSRGAKSIMAAAGAAMQVLELDHDPEGPQIQAALAKLTGRRTVPNVFVRGKSIGGGDDTAALQSQGKLVPLLKDANALKAVTPA